MGVGVFKSTVGSGVAVSTGTVGVSVGSGATVGTSVSVGIGMGVSVFVGKGSNVGVCVTVRVAGTLVGDAASVGVACWVAAATCVAAGWDWVAVGVTNCAGKSASVPVGCNTTESVAVGGFAPVGVSGRRRKYAANPTA